MTNRRTIKFRIWHKKYKRWLTANDYGTHCRSNWMMDVFNGEIFDIVECGNDLSFECEPTYYTEGAEVIKESPIVVQQYTGLKDKNGVEIYEGDIVHYMFDGASYPKEAKDTILICRWDQGNAWFVFDEDLNQDGNGYYWLEIRDCCKVIGNIYENNELLEK